nr:hypothetical protein [Tanacetum cinerariifolium]
GANLSSSSYFWFNNGLLGFNDSFMKSCVSFETRNALLVFNMKLVWSLQAYMFFKSVHVCSNKFDEIPHRF